MYAGNTACEEFHLQFLWTSIPSEMSITGPLEKVSCILREYEACNNYVKRILKVSHLSSCCKWISIVGHFINQHEIEILEERHDLETEDQFQLWKKSVEKSTICKFIKAYTLRNSPAKYVCHGSGDFKSKGKRSPRQTQSTVEIRYFFSRL